MGIRSILVSYDTPQFYTYINQLSALVDNKDEFGSIIGYAVMASLIPFSTQSGSLQDIHFEQLVAVYQELEGAVTSCKATDSFQTLCELNVTVNDFFKEHEENDSPPEPGSPLLKRIMSVLEQKRGVPEDILRRNGLALASAVLDRGALERKVDCLKRDYRLLENIFSN